MISKIETELQKLNSEAQGIVSERDKLHRALQEVEIRLTQITGAMLSLTNLKKEIEDEGSE